MNLKEIAYSYYLPAKRERFAPARDTPLRGNGA